MRIIFDAPGQTCNRLWSYVATVAKCLEKKEKMVVLWPDKEIGHFPGFIHATFIRLPFFPPQRHNKIGRYSLNKMAKLCNNKHFKIVLRLLNSVLSPFNCRFVEGWQHRADNAYFDTQKEGLRKIFRPETAVTSVVDEIFNLNRNTFDLIIGVHIRRGDYKNWRGGTYFFSLEQYYSVMLKCKELYADKKCGFFISSDEHIDTTLFTNCNCFFIPQSSAIKDLYALSICDRIIAPLSTFSRWASFYGEVPIYIIEDPDVELQENDFSFVKDLHHFANGKWIDPSVTPS